MPQAAVRVTRRPHGGPGVGPGIGAGIGPGIGGAPAPQRR
ncbi:hypothetical protein M2167_000017 [Streptomyces sp. SPB4]|nr:hypothetical protein [Streptomyces sp. SPB4]